MKRHTGFIDSLILKDVDRLSVHNIGRLRLEEHDAADEDVSSVVVLQDALERAAEAGVAVDDVFVLREAGKDVDRHFTEALHPGVPLLGEHRGALQHQAEHGVGFQQRLLVMDLRPERAN